MYRICLLRILIKILHCDWFPVTGNTWRIFIIGCLQAHRRRRESETERAWIIRVIPFHAKFNEDSIYISPIICLMVYQLVTFLFATKLSSYFYEVKISTNYEKIILKLEVLFILPLLDLVAFFPVVMVITRIKKGSKTWNQARNEQKVSLVYLWW
jgi:hypothetical protein